MPHWRNTCPHQSIRISPVGKVLRWYIWSDLSRYDYLPVGNKPNDAGIQPTFPAILDTGANNTYVNDSRLISNIKSDSAFVEIADSSRLPITDSGTLINDPIIQANFAPSFSKNLIGTSPTLIDKEVVGIIQSKNNLAKI